MRIATFLSLAFCGCVLNLNIDRAALLACVDGVCPDGWTCEPGKQLCVQSQNLLGDSDLDSIADAFDTCQGGDDRLDTDADGVPNECDTCAVGDDALDADTDGVPDACDACAGSDDKADVDRDGTPDACDSCAAGSDALDADDDGKANACDPCPGGDEAQDADGDTVADACDACANADDRNDVDLDGVPDACDVCPDASDLADKDGDGHPDACDLCPTLPNGMAAASDPIEAMDLVATDSNCDGVDGERARVVFVSVFGTPSGDGSLAAPLDAIQTGVDLAAATLVDSDPTNDKPQVFVSSGGYLGGPLAIPSGIAVYGSFSSTFKRRAAAFASVFVSSGRVGARIMGTTSPVTIDGLTIQTAPASGTDRSAIVVVVSTVAPVMLRSLLLRPGAGRDGVDATVGAGGKNGGPATPSNPRGGGFGGPAAPYSSSDPAYCHESPGGFGAAGAPQSGAPTPGAGGQGSGSSGGSGGAPAACVSTPAPPAPGATAPGQSGAHPSPLGVMTALDAQQRGALLAADDWSAGPGLSGKDGVPGSGGGGGGDTFGATFGATLEGFSGSSGGGGGCGGKPGGTGGGAGGSIGVLALGSPQLTIETTIIQTSNGGNGGRGGDGGLGGAGGPGGAATSADCQMGGRGGAGSAGGRGGGSQGGAGGMSIGMICWNGALPCTEAAVPSRGNVFTLGQAGGGGSGGSNGVNLAPSGPSGLSQATLTLP